MSSSDYSGNGSSSIRHDLILTGCHQRMEELHVALAARFCQTSVGHYITTSTRCRIIELEGCPGLEDVLLLPHTAGLSSEEEGFHCVFSLCPLLSDGFFSHLFIAHSENSSSQHSVCSQGANNHPILYLYSCFIYIANEVAPSVRQSTADLFSHRGL